MSVRIDQGTILLEGRCTVGDAEELLAAMREAPGASVDMAGVLKLHMAVLQVLLALRPAVTGRPAAGALSRDIFFQLVSGGDRRPECS